MTISITHFQLTLTHQNGIIRRISKIHFPKRLYNCAGGGRSKHTTKPVVCVSRGVVTVTLMMMMMMMMMMVVMMMIMQSFMSSDVRLTY